MLGYFESDPTDFVQFKGVGFFPMKCIYINFISNFNRNRHCSTCCMLDVVIFGRIHRSFVHPAQKRFKFLGHFRDIPTADNHIPTTDVDFIFDCNNSCFSSRSFLDLFIVFPDFFDLATET